MLRNVSNSLYLQILLFFSTGDNLSLLIYTNSSTVVIATMHNS